MRTPRWLLPLFASLLMVSTAHAGRASDAALNALVEGAKASHSDTMLVLRDGKVLASYTRPGETPHAIEMMSATKSLVGLAVGRLVTEGKIKSIDEPVSDFYPEWKQGQKAKITVRMLLDHTSGLQNVPNTTVEIYPAPDGIKLALAAELSSPPGTRFSYNNKAMNLLAGVIEQASGMRMDHYIERTILQPMGIPGPAWNTDGGFDHAGHPYAMAGWKATAADAAKIGELVLADGRWHGKQLIDPAYIRAMVGQSQPFTPSYGLLWWRRSADRKMGVSAKAIDAMEQQGIDRVGLEKLRPLVPRTFTQPSELRPAFTQALGAELPTLAKDINAHGRGMDDLIEDRSGPIVAYEANGYLGQYIVVVPKAHLVAVRQIEADPSYDGEGPWPYGYDDFTARVIALARTYTSDLAVPSP